MIAVLYDFRVMQLFFSSKCFDARIITNIQAIVIIQFQLCIIISKKINTKETFILLWLGKSFMVISSSVISGNEGSNCG